MEQVPIDGTVAVSNRGGASLKSLGRCRKKLLHQPCGGVPELRWHTRRLDKRVCRVRKTLQVATRLPLRRCNGGRRHCKWGGPRHRALPVSRCRRRCTTNPALLVLADVHNHCRGGHRDLLKLLRQAEVQTSDGQFSEAKRVPRGATAIGACVVRRGCRPTSHEHATSCGAMRSQPQTTAQASPEVLLDRPVR